ncbi:hypothetical protein RCH07_002795 [Arthrobacter sp. CG_A4]|nr:hypothetical protein [Arthrobacter sp. CG_A4]
MDTTVRDPFFGTPISHAPIAPGLTLSAPSPQLPTPSRRTLTASPPSKRKSSLQHEAHPP